MTTTLTRGLTPRLLTLAAVATPGLSVEVLGLAPPPALAALLLGLAVVAASFALAWAAEAAQIELAGPLVLALVALVAVLPEYAVDLYFAHRSGSDPTYASYAAANMTGSNRLLLGLGWPAVVVVAVLARRRRTGTAPPLRTEAVVLPPERRRELAFLLAGSLLVLVGVVVGSLPLLLGAALLLLYVGYLVLAARGEVTEPDLVGAAALIGALPQRTRRRVTAGLGLVAAAVVLTAARPFADALVESGTALGVDQFLLVQWVAPLASETPEFLVALLLATRGDGAGGLALLLSSKVNQWTLLVGSLPFAHALGGGGGALELDARQVEELLLTVAQTGLGLALLSRLRLGVPAAAALLALFAVQFVLPGETSRLWLSGVYVVIGAGVLLQRRLTRPAPA